MRPKKNIFLNKGLPIDLKQESKKMQDKLNQLKSLIQKQKQQRNTTERFIKTKQKLRQQPKIVSPEIDKFLKDLGYSQYYDVFIKNGVDSMDILIEVKKQELEEIGVLKGHAIKIVKSLKADKQAPVQNNFVSTVQNRQTTLNTAKTEILQTNKHHQIKSNPQQVNIQKTYSNFQQCQSESYTVSFKQRYFCQRCFKNYYQNNLEGFCSLRCQKIFEQQNYVACQQCSKKQKRWQCHKIDNGFLCSDECLNKLISKLEEEIKVQQFQQQELYWNEQQPQLNLDRKQLSEIQKMLGNFQ